MLSSSRLLRQRLSNTQSSFHHHFKSYVTKASSRTPILLTGMTHGGTAYPNALLLSGIVVVAGISLNSSSYYDTTTTKCAASRRLTTPITDPLMIAPQKEPATGILFPGACNGMTLVGCGVRVKWRFVKVYAVGTYVDPAAMRAVKKQGKGAIEKALLDPLYPRTIRITMNRSLSIKKYTDAIVEALEPRMDGEDMDKLEEFKKLNPSIDLVEGAVMEMTIRGNTMLYKNAVGGIGMIHSEVFCKAMCDVFYGDDAVSPTHKSDVIAGVQALK